MFNQHAEPKHVQLLFVYTILDQAAAAFLQPFFATNQEIAKRMVRSAQQDPNHPMHVNAKEMALFELGTFDQLGGKLQSHDAMRSVCNLATLLPPMGSGDTPVLKATT